MTINLVRVIPRMNHNIAFKEYSKKNDIHGTALYPAVMVAPVQKRILKNLFSSCNIESVFDPFHGSGTALYEAFEISENIRLIGCDINPLANLFTKVKLQGVSLEIYKNIDRFKEVLQESEYDHHYFPYIEKWFRTDIILELSKIRNAIIKIKNKRDRQFLWYMMCDIIRKYSNTRSSTYKLYIKEKEKIASIKNNVVSDYINSIETNAHKFYKKCDNFYLYKSDVLKFLDIIPDEEFDISITSPPYGDNKTTVTYGQFSMLPLHWIDAGDLELEGWELENYSIIDYKSLGGSKNKRNINSYGYMLLYPYLSRISDNKQRKVISFFCDYFKVLDQLCRVTKYYIVLTLGNRTVDGVQIDLTNISMKYLEYHGFENTTIYTREIPCKRTPRILDRDKMISSMNMEYVIIHKRKANT